MIPYFEDKVNSFDFNVFQFDELEKQQLVYSIFVYKNYMTEHCIPPTELSNFLFVLRKKYNWETETKRVNPFHNFNHGITVMQGCYNIATNTVAKKYLDPISDFSLVLAGLCHDVKVSSGRGRFVSEI